MATTLSNYHRQLADNVCNSNAVTALLRQGNRIRVVEGGKAITTPLTYAEETFAWYTGTELLSRAVKETISEADYEPANAVASVTLSGPDLAKNRGRERIINLLEGKIDNAEATMKNNITKAVYGGRHGGEVLRGAQGDGHRRRPWHGRRHRRRDLGLLEEPVPDASPAPPACNTPPSRLASTRSG